MLDRLTEWQPHSVPMPVQALPLRLLYRHITLKSQDLVGTPSRHQTALAGQQVVIGPFGCNDFFAEVVASLEMSGYRFISQRQYRHVYFLSNLPNETTHGQQFERFPGRLLTVVTHAPDTRILTEFR